jgi:hypothetical protein
VSECKSTSLDMKRIQVGDNFAFFATDNTSARKGQTDDTPPFTQRFCLRVFRQPTPNASCFGPKPELTFLAMNVQELAEGYRHKADIELLRLALTPDQLTPEAYHALTAELASRGIGSDASLEAARQ